MARLVLRLLGIAVEQVGDGFHFVPALKAELRKIACEPIGKGLALEHNRNERALPGINQARLNQQPCIDAIQEQLGLNCKVDERAALRADVFFAAQILDQIGAPLRQGSAEGRSAINYPPTQTLNGLFERNKPVL